MWQMKSLSDTSYSTYYRSEFIATDISSAGLGVPVAYAQYSVLVAAAASNWATTILNNLPADLMTQMEDGKQKYQDVMVRSYPISMANQIVYTGFDLWDRVYRKI